MANYPIDWDAMDRAPWNHKCRTCGMTYGQHKHRDLQCPRVPRGRWPWQWWGPTTFDWDNSTPVEYRKGTLHVIEASQNQDGPHTVVLNLIQHGEVTVCPSIECPGCQHGARLAGVPTQQYVDARIAERAVPTMNEMGATHRLRQDADGDVWCTECLNDEMWCLNNKCPEQR
jgi:hypothetical protein